MKTYAILFIAVSALLGRSLLAGEIPAESRASRQARGPEPVERASTLLQEGPAAKDACCQPKKADACCQPAADSAPFSRESLYQIETKFTDDAGQSFTLGQLRGRPVVLTMFFASCGYACPLLVTDMQAIRAQLPAAVRERAVFVLVSFDVTRDTPDALRKYRAERGLDGGWTLLHGDDDAVRELAALLGVKYKQEANGMFSHSNLVTVLNVEGEIVHQRSGLRGGLEEVVASLQRQ